MGSLRRRNEKRNISARQGEMGSNIPISPRLDMIEIADQNQG